MKSSRLDFRWLVSLDDDSDGQLVFRVIDLPISRPPLSSIAMPPTKFVLPLICFALLVICSVAPAQEAAIGRNEGVPIVSWKDAADVVGRTAVVTGKIVNVGATKNNKIHFINFSESDRDAFKLVIFEDTIGNFPADLRDAYLNKLVTVRGIVTLYSGNPQIVLARPDQIKVVDKLPAVFMPSLPRVRVGNDIVFATYNLRNLFDDVDDPYFNDETTQAKPRDELVRVAAILREINADVIAFQEVESRGYLKRFLEVFVPDMGYKNVVHYEGNDLRGIDVCLASRAPIGRVISHRHLWFVGPDGKSRKFNRDLLRIEILPSGGTPFEAWVLHLKSNHGGREAAEPIRLAEARQVYKLVGARLRQNPQADLIVCGDFNDVFDSATIRTIMGAGQADRKPILRALFNKVPEDQRITYNREPHRSMIDFILVSPSMARRYVPNSYRIRNGTLEESGSDHNPVYCKFTKKVPAQQTRNSPSGAAPR